MSVDSPIAKSDRLFINEDRDLDYWITDGVPTATFPLGTPIDCSAMALLWELFTRVDPVGSLLVHLSKSASEIVTATSVNGTLASVTNDIVRVKLRAQHTVDQTTGAVLVAPNTYWFELWRPSPANSRNPLSTGSLVLQPARRRIETT